MSLCGRTLKNQIVQKHERTEIDSGSPTYHCSFCFMCALCQLLAITIKLLEFLLKFLTKGLRKSGTPVRINVTLEDMVDLRQ